ncbi:MAG: LamG-like jellyroll fold domain-containing protein [Candidatus Pollutiaquabacter aromativorans]
MNIFSTCERPLRAIRATLFCLGLMAISLISATPANAQDYRSRQSGDWDDLATWEFWNGSGWNPASLIPDHVNCSTLTIMPSHVVTITAYFAHIDQLTIMSDGTLRIVEGNLEVLDGPGTDIQCYGNIDVNTGSIQLQHGSIIVDDGGSFDLSSMVNVSGPGTIDIIGGSTASFSSNGDPIVLGDSLVFTVSSAASATLGGNGDLQLAGHFTFNLDGSFEIDSDADITTNALVNGQINGTGSFSKQGGIGTTSVGSPNLLFAGSLSVSVYTGVLEMACTITNPGATTSELIVDADATLQGSTDFVFTGVNITNNGSILTDRLILTGENTMNYDGNGTIRHLVMDNPSAYLDFSNALYDLTVTEELELLNGRINMNGGRMVMPATCVLTGGNEGSYVIGRVLRGFYPGNNPRVFPVGDPDTYAPVTIAPDLIGNGDFLVETFAGDHPDVNNSGINEALSINRYWSVDKLLSNVRSCAVTFQWHPADLDGGVDLQQTRGVLYNDGLWMRPVIFNRTDSTLTLDELSLFGDFQLGEAPALPGAALAFDGQDDYVQGPVALLPLNDSAYTFSAWAKVNVINGTYATIASQSRGFYLGYGLTGEIRVGDSWINTGVQYPTDNAWHNLTVVRAMDNTYLYIDGVLAATAGFVIPSPGPVFDNPIPTFYIGSQFYGNSEVWNGAIDEVRVWNRALCEREVAEVAGCEISGSADGLVAVYNFNQGLAEEPNPTFDNMLLDASGNGRHATTVNFNWSGSASNWIRAGGVATGNGCNSPSYTVAYFDQDEDNFGRSDMTVVYNSLCDVPPSYRLVAGDCDDNNPAVHPRLTLPTGAIAFLPFNGNAQDESGTGNNGIVQGATLTTDRFGHANNAYEFNGFSSFIEILNDGDFNVSDLTLAAWIRPDGAGSGTVMSKSFGVGGLSSFIMNADPGADRLDVVYGADPANDTVAGSPLQQGVWQFVAFTFNGNTKQAELYIDGARVGTVNSPGVSLGADGSSVVLGADVAPFMNNFFQGAIDEVMIYGRVLTSEEILRISSATRDPGEVCNGIDDDCNGLTDEGDTTPPTITNGNNLLQSYRFNSGLLEDVHGSYRAHDV